MLDLGGNQGDSQGPGGVPPSGGTEGHRDDGKTRSKRRVGVPLVIGGNGSRGIHVNLALHQEVEDNHST